jgi:hypothetical protein
MRRDLAAEPAGSLPHGIVRWYAVGAIILANQSILEHSECARSVMFACWEPFCNIPRVLGKQSPFENLVWDPFEALRIEQHWPPTVRLQVCSFIRHSRLPRLIAYVRALRSADGLQDIDAATCQATLLLGVEDKDAEAEILHRVQVKRTEDPEASLVSK